MMEAQEYVTPGPPMPNSTPHGRIVARPVKHIRLPAHKPIRIFDNE